MPANPNFVYNPGYPKNCSNFDPNLYPVNDFPVCDLSATLPLGQFPVPSVGQSYIDPNLGSKVTVLTPTSSIHGYNSPSAFSASGKYAAVGIGVEQVDVIDTKTGEVLRHGGKGTVSVNTVRWDATNDAVYYFTQGAKVQKYNWQTDTLTTLIDYSVTPYNFSNLDYGGTGDTSSDNWLPFYDLNTSNVCALNLNDANPLNGTYCADYSTSTVAQSVPILSQNIDSVLISKGVDSISGKRYVLLAAHPSIAVFSVDQINKQLHFEYRGPEFTTELNNGAGNNDGICDPGENCLRDSHEDTYQDADGQQYIFIGMDSNSNAGNIATCARNVGSLRLNAGTNLLKDVSQGGGRKLDMTLSYCIGFDPAHENFFATHFGCAKDAPICAFETYDPTLRDPSKPSDLTKSFFPGTHLGEIFIMVGNGLTIKPLAMHNSVPFTEDPYWYTPRVSVSNDGTKVIWDSNFGYWGDQSLGQNREYVVEADIGSLSVDTTPPVLSAISSSALTQTSTNITWTTNEAADTQVQYGLSTAYGSSSSLIDLSGITSHSIILSGLTAGTTYHYVVQSNDLSGNLSISSDQTFTTTAAVVGGGGGGGGGTPPLVYSGISALSTTTTTSLISWQTVGNSVDSYIDYGTTSVYTLTASSSVLTQSHTLILNNLIPQAVYHFRVRASGGVSSSDYSFTTGSGLTMIVPTVPIAPTSTPQVLANQVKLINNSGTYYLIQNGLRYGITNPGMLASYGFSLNQAQAPTAQDLALPTGPNLTPQDGSLVKSKEDQTVYLISNQNRYSFTSAKVLLALGFKFSSVLTVTNPELQILPKVQNINNGQDAHLPGTDISENGTVYWIDYNGQKEAYPSLLVYDSWHLAGDFSQVVQANAQDLKLPIGSLVRARAVSR